MALARPGREWGLLVALRELRALRKGFRLDVVLADVAETRLPSRDSNQEETWLEHEAARSRSLAPPSTLTAMVFSTPSDVARTVASPSAPEGLRIVEADPDESVTTSVASKRPRSVANRTATPDPTEAPEASLSSAVISVLPVGAMTRGSALSTIRRPEPICTFASPDP